MARATLAAVYWSQEPSTTSFLFSAFSQVHHFKTCGPDFSLSLLFSLLSRVFPFLLFYKLLKRLTTLESLTETTNQTVSTPEFAPSMSFRLCFLVPFSTTESRSLKSNARSPSFLLKSHPQSQDWHVSPVHCRHFSLPLPHPVELASSAFCTTKALPKSKLPALLLQDICLFVWEISHF